MVNESGNEGRKDIILSIIKYKVSTLTSVLCWTEWATLK